MLSNRRGTVAAVTALTIAVAGPVALAVQNATAASDRPAPAQKGLLDPILGVVTGLTDVLKGLLDTSALSQLTSLTGVLNGGGDASSSALAPVTDLLQDLAAGDPANAASLNEVAALTQAGSGGQLATPFLEPVAAMLGQLAGLNGLTGDQVSALTSLQSALNAIIAGGQATDAVAGLPLGNLPLDSTQLLALGDLLSTLQGGTASSPQLLAPVSDLLDNVAGTSGLPAPIAEVMTSVSGELRSSSSLDADLLKQVGQLLNAIAATPGVPAEAGALLGQLSGLLGSPGTPTGTTPTTTTPTTTTPKPPTTTTTTTPKPPTTTTTTTTTTPRPGGTGVPGAGTTAKVPATLKRVRYDRKRGSLVLTLTCPAGSKACGSIIYALSGSRSVVKPQIVLLADGQIVERRMRLDAKSRRALRKKAVKLTVYAITSKTQVASKALKIAKAKKQAARR
ncbi:MAG TPA: hypothetical protein VFZ89_06525 [Solirubrobacteraceae bacterium]